MGVITGPGQCPAAGTAQSAVLASHECWRCVRHEYMPSQMSCCRCLGIRSPVSGIRRQSVVSAKRCVSGAGPRTFVPLPSAASPASLDALYRRCWRQWRPRSEPGAGTAVFSICQVQHIDRGGEAVPMIVGGKGVLGFVESGRLAVFL